MLDVTKEELAWKKKREEIHKSWEDTYRCIAGRYWWDNLYSEVRFYVYTCKQYQLRDPSGLEKALHPTCVILLWQKVGLEVIFISPCKEMKYFVVTSCYLSGWIEAKFICNLTPKAITRFLWKDIICWHCCFRNLVVDGKSKNKNAVQKLALWYGIKKMIVSAYHL